MTFPVHTCEGSNHAPALAWTGAPPATESFALIVDDPDAPDPDVPKMTWVHWIIYNLPASSRGLAEGEPLPAGALAGVNDWKRTGWDGPCPPIGRHRYFFKPYALDTSLPDLEQPTKVNVEKVMAGHVLAQAELVGTYHRRHAR